MCKLILMAALASSILTGLSAPPAEPTDLQKAMAKEFGDYGKVPVTAKYYKELTWKGLKVDIPGQKNRKVQTECRFLGVRSKSYGNLETHGYPIDKYFHMNVADGTIPLVAPRRKKDLVEVFGKLNRGARIKIYGRVKEQRIPGTRKRKAYTVYLVELDHLTVLENDKPGDAVADEGAEEEPPAKPKRPKKKKRR